MCLFDRTNSKTAEKIELILILVFHLSKGTTLAIISFAKLQVKYGI